MNKSRITSDARTQYEAAYRLMRANVRGRENFHEFHRAVNFYNLYAQQGLASFYLQDVRQNSYVSAVAVRYETRTWEYNGRVYWKKVEVRQIAVTETGRLWQKARDARKGYHHFYYKHMQAARLRYSCPGNPGRAAKLQKMILCIHAAYTAEWNVWAEAVEVLSRLRLNPIHYVGHDLKLASPVFK